MRIFFCIAGFLLTFNYALASLEAVNLTYPSVIPQSRWIAERNTGNVAPKYKRLADLKKAHFEGKWAECSRIGNEVYKTQRLLRPWILTVVADCDLKIFETKKNVQAIREHIANIQKQSDWLLKGAYSEALKKLLVKSQFAVLDWEIKNRPQTAWLKVGDLLDLSDWMNTEEKAKCYRMAGELAFLQQNLTTAKAYVARSLGEVDDPKLREKLNSIEAIIVSKPTNVTEGASKNITAVLLGEEEQQETVERMTQALKTGDLLSAIKDGIDLIAEYPGSSQADWAAMRIIESYLSVVQLDEKKYRVMRFDFIDEMKEADPKRLFEWAQKTYKVGQYRDSSSLLLEAYSKLKDAYVPVDLIDLLAKSYLHSGELSNATKIFKEISKKYTGTKAAAEANLSMGLILFKNKDYAKAQGHFEKVLAQPQFEDLELTARYWLWRCAEHTDKARAQVEVQLLTNKFPFSYYGLRAIAETNGGIIDFTSLDRPINKKLQIWLTPEEKNSWDRVELLIGAGWFEEAKLELEQIPQPSTPDGMMLFARYYAASLNYSKAITLFNKAWDENSEFRALQVVKMAFPKEFTEFIAKSSQERKMDPNLVISLIRQESAFAPKAESTSGALGLMQIIPPTATEIAGTLKIKNLEIPQALYSPETNIQIGTYYISKMINDFGGNIPLGLAAYNAGPTRLKRWVASTEFKAQSSSSPDYEVWVDLLPWSETRFYVKAILRNYLIYQLIEKKKIQVLDPVWTSPKI